MFLEFATKTIQMDLIAVLRSNRLTVTRHLNRIRVMMEIFPILVIKMLRHIIKNSHQEKRVRKNRRKSSKLSITDF
jgi:hypothetical protein